MVLIAITDEAVRAVLSQSRGPGFVVFDSLRLVAIFFGHLNRNDTRETERGHNSILQRWKFACTD